MKRIIFRQTKIIILTILLLGFINCQNSSFHKPDVVSIDRERILTAAEEYLKEKPKTITAYKAERSAGGKHDFFSEGDYWWPDPENPDGPYIRRDGMSNPNKFDKHREVMIRLSIQVPTLAAAYEITGDEKYAKHAMKHLRAWFINESTHMNPNLEYAQAIKGRCTGRGVGIIDTIHLIEVAQSIKILVNCPVINSQEIEKVKNWFEKYLTWMTTHPYGIDEKKRENNHGTWWTAQVAEFASLVNNDSLLTFCRNRYKNVLVPNQISPEGKFPLELERTKPYNYSLFNLDGMALCCHILSTEKNNLWHYETEKGAGIQAAMEFMYPYIKDKSKWPYKEDVMYYDKFPVRQPSLLFAGIAYEKPKYIQLWKQLEPDPTTHEVIRNFPIRQPVLWIENGT